MMMLAEKWGERSINSNPCLHVDRFDETERSHVLSVAQLKELGETLTEAEAAPDAPSAAIEAIRFLALSGCRVGEVLGLTWDCVDLEAGTIDLTDAKAGPRLVALGAPACAILARLKYKTEKGSVFQIARGKPLAYHRLSRAWLGIRKAAGLGDTRIHDLRHGYGTAAGGLGLNAFIIRDLLGHKTLAMTGKYVAADVNPLREAADRVSGQIAGAMEGREAEVVELSKAKR
jgi:integrase